MKVSFNRLAAQELIGAARKLADAANLGAAFLDEYETWKPRLRSIPFPAPR